MAESPSTELRVRIHQHLKKHPRLTAHELARVLNASISSVRRRLKAMEADGDATAETGPKCEGDPRPRHQVDSDMTTLTPCEQEIAALVVEGLPNSQIADRLHLSSRTVTVAIGHLYRKAGVSYRAEFVEQARQQHASNDAATAARTED